MHLDKIWMKFNVYVKRKKCLERQEENYFLKMIKNIESIQVVISTYTGEIFYYSNQLKTGMPSIISREELRRLRDTLLGHFLLLPLSYLKGKWTTI